MTRQYPGALQSGSVGGGVSNLQYFLAYLSQFYDTIPAPAIDGSFGKETEESVKAAQRTFGLTPDGIVGELTWNAIINAYLGIVNTIPREYVEGVAIPYGGIPLRIGSESDSVRLLQEYLNAVSISYPEIPSVSVTGYFGPRTEEAVIAFQNLFGIPPTGVVAAVTWNALIELYDSLMLGSALQDGQYPGFDVGST